MYRGTISPGAACKQPKRARQAEERARSTEGWFFCLRLAFWSLALSFFLSADALSALSVFCSVFGGACGFISRCTGLTGVTGCVMRCCGSTRGLKAALSAELSPAECLRQGLPGHPPWETRGRVGSRQDPSRAWQHILQGRVAHGAWLIGLPGLLQDNFCPLPCFWFFDVWQNTQHRRANRRVFACQGSRALFDSAEFMPASTFRF